MDTYDCYRGRTIGQQQQQQVTALADVPTIEYRGRHTAPLSSSTRVAPQLTEPRPVNRFDQRKGGGKGSKGRKKGGNKSNANKTPLGPRKIPVDGAKPSQQQEQQGKEGVAVGRAPLGELCVSVKEGPTTAVKEEAPKLDREAMADMYKQAMTQSDVPQWK